MRSKKNKYIRITGYVIIIVTLFLFGAIIIPKKIFEVKQKENLLGLYEIDITKTDYSNYPLDDVRNCKLMINSDGSFVFNKDYPFIYNYKGKWKPRKAGVEEWNYFYFDKPSFNDSQSSISCQVGDSWIDNTTDSLIVFNSLTPKQNKKPIHILFMQKVNKTYHNKVEKNIIFSNEEW